MLAVINFTPGVEITLLSKSLIVRRSAVGAPQSKGYLILSPPIVIQVLCFSFFFAAIISNYPPVGDISQPITGYLTLINEK